MKMPEAFMNFAYWVIGSLTDIYYRVQGSRADRLIVEILCLGLIALGIVVALGLLWQFLSCALFHFSFLIESHRQ